MPVSGADCSVHSDASNDSSDWHRGPDAEVGDESEEAGNCLRMVAPHKLFIGQQREGGAGACVSLTGMEFNPPTQTLMLTTKTVMGNAVTFAVSQLQPAAAAAATPLPTPGGKQPHPHPHPPGLTTVRTQRYRASLEHHGDLRIASCGRDAPGELVCAGSDRTGARHGVFRLQALSATQPVLAQCCGPTGERLGQFNRPAGCAVDAGCAYVADRLNHRIQRLALPTLAPLGAMGHPRMSRPSHLAVFADPHFGRRLLLAAHEGGVVAFDLAATAAGAAAPAEFACGRARRWGGVCVHWGAVLLADQDANCVLVYSRFPVGPGSGLRT